MRGNRINDDRDEDVDEDEAGQHDIAQEKRDGDRRVWPTTDHVRRGSLPQTGARERMPRDRRDTVLRELEKHVL